MPTSMVGPPTSANAADSRSARPPDGCCMMRYPGGRSHVTHSSRKSTRRSQVAERDAGPSSNLGHEHTVGETRMPRPSAWCRRLTGADYEVGITPRDWLDDARQIVSVE